MKKIFVIIVLFLALILINCASVGDTNNDFTVKKISPFQYDVIWDTSVNKERVISSLIVDNQGKIIGIPVESKVKIISGISVIINERVVHDSVENITINIENIGITTMKILWNYSSIDSKLITKKNSDNTISVSVIPASGKISKNINVEIPVRYIPLQPSLSPMALPILPPPPIELPIERPRDAPNYRSGARIYYDYMIAYNDYMLKKNIPMKTTPSNISFSLCIEYEGKRKFVNFAHEIFQHKLPRVP